MFILILSYFNSSSFDIQSLYCQGVSHRLRSTTTSWLVCSTHCSSRTSYSIQCQCKEFQLLFCISAALIKTHFEKDVRSRSVSTSRFDVNGRNLQRLACPLAVDSFQEQWYPCFTSFDLLNQLHIGNAKSLV